MLDVRNYVASGTLAATKSAMGFFGAGVLHLGATATFASLGSAAAAGFVGGLVVYFPAVCLRALMIYNGQVNRMLLSFVDFSLQTLSIPLGAWMLGLAIQPFLIAALTAAAVHSVITIFNVICDKKFLGETEREGLYLASSPTLGRERFHPVGSFPSTL